MAMPGFSELEIYGSQVMGGGFEKKLGVSQLVKGLEGLCIVVKRES